MGLKRPPGVTLVAVLLAGAAGAFVLTGALFAILPDALTASGFRSAPGLARRLLGFGFFGGVGLLFAHMGRGLWCLQGPARSYAITLGWLGMAACVERVVDGATSYVTLGLAGLACGGLVWYMTRPRVRAAFTAARPE